MAVKAYVDQQLNALPVDLRYPLQQAFHYLMDSWRVGTAPRAENAQWYRVQATTPVSSNTEFAVTHGIGTAPETLIQVLDLTAINSQMVPLTVSRAADAERVYLKSPSTNAVFTLLLE